MENQTYKAEFKLLPFSTQTNYTSLIAGVFFLLYIFGLIINAIIITLIYTNNQLHTPMYLFLCNLAFVDIFYTTTTVPKLLYMLLSGDNTVSFIQCFTQMYFYIMIGSTENILIFIMAFDRYVAICNPLHYHNILNSKKSLLFVSANWIFGCLNSLVFTVPVSQMSFCHSRTVKQFFCDAKALFNISCAGSETFYIIICVEAMVFGIVPAVLSLASYVMIIKVILQIKSKEGRKKVFSTCSSHLTIVIIYYTTGAAVYMRPTSQCFSVLEPVFTVLYAFVTPMVNPLIYSLRNKDVKTALQRLLFAKPTVEE